MLFPNLLSIFIPDFLKIVKKNFFGLQMAQNTEKSKKPATFISKGIWCKTLNLSSVIPIEHFKNIHRGFSHNFCILRHPRGHTPKPVIWAHLYTIITCFRFFSFQNWQSYTKTERDWERIGKGLGRGWQPLELMFVRPMLEIE